MTNIMIFTKKTDDLESFLQMQGFLVEKLENDILRVVREDELPVYVSVQDENLYFEVDLGNVTSIGSEKLYFKLLDSNTDILPVSFAINDSNPDDPHLVLVESRETTDLSDSELLAVFDALELAAEKAETILSEFVK